MQWEAKCEERNDWKRSLGFDPDSVCTYDLFVLVKGHAARPGSWRDQVLDQAEQRRVRYLARLKRQGDARPKVPLPDWMRPATVTLVPADNTPYPVVDERLVLAPQRTRGGADPDAPYPTVDE